MLCSVAGCRSVALLCKSDPEASFRKGRVRARSMCIWLLDTPFHSVLSSHPIRLQKEGSDDSTPSSERLGVHVKGEEECGSVHIKGESTESELEEEEEDEDVIQLREGDEEERGSYSQVCV